MLKNWPCNPLVWNVTEMVTSMCQHQGLTKKQLRGVEPPGCNHGKMQGFLVGDPLTKHKDTVVTGILPGAFFKVELRKSLKIAIPFPPWFPNPQIKLNENLIHLQSNPWTLLNSNFLNPQTSKPNPTNRSSDGLSDFLGHWKCPSPPLRCQSSGLTKKSSKRIHNSQPTPKRITRHLWKLPAGSGKKLVVCI